MGSIITPVMAFPHPANVVTLDLGGRSQHPGHVRQPAHDREWPPGTPADRDGLGIGAAAERAATVLGLVMIFCRRASANTSAL
jgi:hypothetical protein